jgi:hypothetical protein
MAKIALSLLALSGVAFADPAGPDPDKTAVCTDGKGHYVAIGPHENVIHAVYYGDAKKLHYVKPAPMMGGDWFFEPRYWSRTNNDNFRGMDLRVFSHVDYDADKKTCAVTCGERVTKLTLLEPTAGRAVIEKATFAEPDVSRVPHTLARDENANYYYVDKGSTPETEKNFRLFVGKKGALKLQKMTDVAADSEGEIFSTKTGSLRLILSKDNKRESLWVAGKKTDKLLIVPVDANLKMIYTELGVYTGLKLGNPCDDL